MKTKCLLLLSVLTLALWSCQKEEPIVPVEQTEVAAVEQAAAGVAESYALLSIYGGTSPFFVSIHLANDPTGPAIRNLGRYDTRSIKLACHELYYEIPHGANVVFKVKDATGYEVVGAPTTFIVSNGFPYFTPIGSIWFPN